MKFSAAALGLAATAAALPGGAPSGLKPDAGPPAGCSLSHPGKFQLSVFKVGSGKRSIEKRDCSGDKALVISLNNGVLTDSHGRIGEIVKNYQFQFDGPPAQAGTIYDDGFSVCQNGSLAIGASTVFYECLSGGFNNLYDRSWAAQCEPIEIVAQSCDASSGGASPSQIHDGQVQAPTNAPVLTQISDGQVQGPKSIPVISQISDGQIQAPTGGAPVSQISDGQVQAPKSTGAPISQISDGQVQAPTGGAKITQISDGQVQAPTSTGAPVTQISDGQVQAPTGGAKISQISDGQVQAPTSAPAVPTANAGVKAAPALFAAGMGAVLFL